MNGTAADDDWLPIDDNYIVLSCLTAVKDISNNELRDDTTDSLAKVVDELGLRASIVVEFTIKELASGGGAGSRARM